MYIAFTFFTLVTVVFFFTRLSILTFCINVINRRALRLLVNDWRIISILQAFAVRNHVLVFRAFAFRQKLLLVRRRFVKFAGARGKLFSVRKNLYFLRLQKLSMFLGTSLGGSVCLRARARSVAGFSILAGTLFSVRI